MKESLTPQEVRELSLEIEATRRAELRKLASDAAMREAFPLLVEACKGLIAALRKQAHIAAELAGPIALSEENRKAWDDARAALAAAEKVGK